MSVCAYVCLCVIIRSYPNKHLICVLLEHVEDAGWSNGKCSLCKSKKGKVVEANFNVSPGGVRPPSYHPACADNERYQTCNHACLFPFFYSCYFTHTHILYNIIFICVFLSVCVRVRVCVHICLDSSFSHLIRCQ